MASLRRFLLRLLNACRPGRAEPELASGGRKDVCRLDTTAVTSDSATGWSQMRERAWKSAADAGFLALPRGPVQEHAAAMPWR